MSVLRLSELGRDEQQPVSREFLLPRQRRADDRRIEAPRVGDCPAAEGDLDVDAVRTSPEFEPQSASFIESPLAGDGIARPPAVRRSLQRTGHFAAQVLVVFLAGLLVVSNNPAPLVGLGVLIFSIAMKYHAGPTPIRSALPRLGSLLTDIAIPLAAVAVGVVYAGLARFQLRDAVVVLVAVTVADVATNLWRYRFDDPIRVVVVGDRETLAGTKSRLSARTQVVCGLVLDPETADLQSVEGSVNVRNIHGIGEVADLVRQWAADVVVVTPCPGVRASELRTLSWDLERVGASLAVAGVLDSVAPHRIECTNSAGSTWISARSSRPSTYVRAEKWVIDRVLGALFLVIVSPVIAVCCLAIRLESGGPALFKQVRVGRRGRLFTMYKLRTMRCDAEALRATLDKDDGNGVLFKMYADPRITRIGRFLRRSSMDELPQLINVALGQMSLVGPRPALPDEVEKYDQLARRRMAVRPGMTGLWQVSGRSDLSWAESVDLDLQYADNYRISGDLLIGLRTVGAVARSKGAY